ncbi:MULTISPECIES: hypothetical protein [unclassified Kocuria]|uniref:hypothetical protein n=1 Tax=unclassified Kocuria TaxID=2649579 RepID=UPI000F86DBA0|nr:MULTISPECIES: hypothetical protein [unclassified Kocuria]
MNNLDPAIALKNIETALRLVVISECGGSWLEMKGAPPERELIERSEEEARRRRGVRPSSDLLEYVQFPQLCNIILGDWDKFTHVFGAKQEFQALIKIVGGVRNTIAHSREVAIFESYLLAGISGRIRAQVGTYRESRDGGVVFYPRIENVSDTFGNNGIEGLWLFEDNFCRLNVGDELEFRAAAFSPRESELQWKVCVNDSTGAIVIQSIDDLPVAATGSDVVLRYVITEDNIGEDFQIKIILTTNNKYHRHMEYESSFDDSRTFGYSVNPPMRE